MYVAQLGSNPQLPICNGGDEYGIGAYYVDKMGRESGNHPYGHFAFSAKFKRSADSTSALEFINSNDTRIKNYTVIKSQD